MNYLTPLASLGGEPFKIVAASQSMGARNATASVLNYRLVHIQAHLLVFLSGVVLAFFVLPTGTIATPILIVLAVILVVLGSLLIEYAARVFSMLEFFIIARGIGHPVTFGTAFLIGGFSSLVVNLFFFMPFNVGSQEGGLYAIFGALGLPARLGVAAAVLSRLRELSWIAIGLLLVLA